MLVAYSDGWFAIPAPEIFSRNSGTCLILGDRTHTSQPYAMKLGDCFRLGSVGLVVTEMKLAGEEAQRLDSKIVQVRPHILPSPPLLSPSRPLSLSPAPLRLPLSASPSLPPLL